MSALYQKCEMFIAEAAIAKGQICTLGTGANTAVPAVVASVYQMVAKDAAAIGEKVECVIEGEAEVKAGGTLAKGISIGATSGGLAVANSTNPRLGFTKKAGVLSDLITVHIDR